MREYYSDRGTVFTLCDIRELFKSNEIQVEKNINMCYSFSVKEVISMISILPAKAAYLLLVAVSVILCAALLALFKGKLPRDHGREFAFNGALSAGKIRGAGIIFVCSFIITALIFVPVSLEYVFYYILIFLGMLSGYLDDRSEKPWGEYKKGLIDLVISALTAANFVYFNRELTSVRFFGMSLHINPIVFGVIAAVLVWMLINAVNCSDGIDGFCTSLTIVSLISVAAAGHILGMEKNMYLLTAIMILTLLPYLWKNAEPSTMLMGDAGSRALGLFLCICILKSGNILLVIPLCFMISIFSSLSGTPPPQDTIALSMSAISFKTSVSTCLK